ncbi:MAG: pentapeptide repeat-containing protein [Caldilineaceae bacterium]
MLSCTKQNCKTSIFLRQLLARANLQRADLARAELFKTAFSSADLRNANLSLAYLQQANFRLARLQGAEFRDATGLDDADFHQAIYDNKAIWPTGFDPQSFGAKLSSNNSGYEV